MVSIVIFPFRRALMPLWPYGLLLALVAAFFWDGLFGNRAFFLRDAFAGIPAFPGGAPRALQTDEWLHWWNPLRGFGKPYIADPEVAFFYPLNWVYYLLSPGQALVTHGALHLFILAASLYALGRQWTLSTGPSLLVAVCFTFSTYMIAALEFRAPFAVVVWGPLELLLVTRIIEQTRRAATRLPWFACLWDNFALVLLLATVLSLQYLAGHPQMMLNTLLLVGGFIAARCAWLSDPRALRDTGTALAVAGALAFGATMLQFLPSWVFIHHSERAAGIDPQLHMASVHPSHWLAFLFPFLDGRPGYPHEFWGKTLYEYWVGACHVGVAPLILASFCGFAGGAQSAAREGGKENEMLRFLTWFFAAAVVVSLVLAAGEYTPAYMALYHYFPGFNHFRWPGKFLLIFLYGTVFLAGIGVQALLTEPGAAKAGRRAWVWAGWLFVLLVVASGFVFAVKWAGFWDWITGGRFVSTVEHIHNAKRDYACTLAFLVLGVALVGAWLKLPGYGTTWMALLIIICFSNLFIVGRQIHPLTTKDIYAYRPEINRLLAAGPMPYRVHSNYAPTVGQYLYGDRNRDNYLWARNAGMENSYQSLGVFDTYQGNLKLLNWSRIYQALVDAPPEQAARLADIMNIRYVVSGPPFEQVLWGNAEKKIEVRERSSTLPRAYVVETWVQAPDDTIALQKLLAPDFDPRRSAVVQATTASPIQAPPLPASTPVGEVLSIHYRWNSVTLQVSAARTAMVILSDTWFPGWKAFVAGTETPIYRADLNFRGVIVPPGRNEIVFRYEPREVAVGLVISAIVVLAMLFAAVARLRVPRAGTSTSKA